MHAMPGAIMTANGVNGTSNALPYRNGTPNGRVSSPNSELQAADEQKKEDRIIVGVDFGTTYSG